MQRLIGEALRYLGVRRQPEEALLAQMTALAQEASARITPRRIWRVLPLQHAGGELLLGRLPLPGRSAAKMLADCRECALLVCTLGTEFDAFSRQLQARDMTRAVMLDALGSAAVEAACDEAEVEIAARLPGIYLTDRFSPGYGDLPLSLQPALLELAEARRVGVKCTSAMLMAPQKSVSALIGLADRPQQARIRGCDYCSMKAACILRKAGKTCNV